MASTYTVEVNSEAARLKVVLDEGPLATYWCLVLRDVAVIRSGCCFFFFSVDVSQKGGIVEWKEVDGARWIKIGSTIWELVLCVP